MAGDASQFLEQSLAGRRHGVPQVAEGEVARLVRLAPRLQDPVAVRCDEQPSVRAHVGRLVRVRARDLDLLAGGLVAVSLAPAGLLAERERLVGDFNTHLQESLDVDTVLRTAVLEMRQMLGSKYVTLVLGKGNES